LLHTATCLMADEILAMKQPPASYSCIFECIPVIPREVGRV